MRAAIDHTPCEARCADRRRARDRVLPAHDGRLIAAMTPDRSASRREDFDPRRRGRGADRGAHGRRRGRHLHRPLPRRGRTARRARTRALSRHGRGRDRAASPTRRARAGRSPASRSSTATAGSCPGEQIVLVVAASAHRARRLRGRRVPDGLSQDPRAVLEARASQDGTVGAWVEAKGEDEAAARALALKRATLVDAPAGRRQQHSGSRAEVP